jgi:hypothetical protein
MSQQPEPNSEAELQRMRDEVERLRRDLELLDDPETICSFGQAAFDGDGVEQDYVRANACKLNRLGREDFLLGGSILIAGSC